MERRKFVQQLGVAMAAAPLIHTAPPASAAEKAALTLRRAFASAKPCVIEVSVDPDAKPAKPDEVKS